MKLESSKLELSKQMIKTCLEMESRGINQGTSGIGNYKIKKDQIP